MKEKKEICIEALNLKTQKLNGYKLLTVYSKEYGLLKLTGSKLGGRSEPFVHNCFWINFGQEEIHRIVQTEFMGHFSKLNLNLERISHAWQYIAFLEACSEGHDEKSSEIFNLLFNSLQALQDKEDKFESISLHFLWQLSIYLGYQPCLGLCHLGTECALKKKTNSEIWLEESPIFDLNAGGIICNSCSDTEDRHNIESVKILPNIYKALLELEKGQMPENTKIIEFLLSLIQRHIQKHISKKIKPLQVFSQIFKSEGF